MGMQMDLRVACALWTGAGEYLAPSLRKIGLLLPRYLEMIT